MKGIYTITTPHNGKVYVGSSKDYERRWKAHKGHLSRGTHHNPHLQNTFGKHGAEAFVFRVIEEVESEEQLLPREQFWIDTLEAVNPEKGYNVLPTAGRSTGYKMSEEARRKIGEANKGSTPHNKGVPRSEEQKEKQRQKMKGRSLTEEARRKIGEAHKGRTPHNKGVPCSEEQKEKQRQKMRGRKAWNSGIEIPDHIYKKMFNEETYRKRSETAALKRASKLLVII